MKNSTLLLAFLVTVQLSNTRPTIAAATLESEGFTRLFDGKTFKGWEGNMDHFRIKAGAVIAGNLVQLKAIGQ